MSSGTQARYDDYVQEAHTKHIDKLSNIGYAGIANKIDAMKRHIKYLEESLESLPRVGWYRVDEIKRIVGEL